MLSTVAIVSAPATGLASTAALGLSSTGLGAGRGARAGLTSNAGAPSPSPRHTCAPRGQERERRASGAPARRTTLPSDGESMKTVNTTVSDWYVHYSQAGIFCNCSAAARLARTGQGFKALPELGCCTSYHCHQPAARRVSVSCQQSHVLGVGSVHCCSHECSPAFAMRAILARVHRWSAPVGTQPGLARWRRWRRAVS
jgi:hypothetical protein